MVVKVIIAFPPDFRLIPSCILSPFLPFPSLSLSPSPSLSLPPSLPLSPSLPFSSLSPSPSPSLSLPPSLPLSPSLPFSSLSPSPSPSLSLPSSLLPLQTNTFQCILASNENNESYVFFLYSDSSMEWPGSPYALVGLNAGDGVHHLTIPTSQSEAVLNIAQTSNGQGSDVWVFRTDASDIIQPGWSLFLSVCMHASCVCVLMHGCMQEQGYMHGI